MNELQLRMYQYKTKLKLTNKEIAKRTGYSVATIDRIAAGKIKAPKLSTIRKIAEVFNCSVEDLAGQEKAVEPCFFAVVTASIAHVIPCLLNYSDCVKIYKKTNYKLLLE